MQHTFTYYNYDTAPQHLRDHVSDLLNESGVIVSQYNQHGECIAYTDPNHSDGYYHLIPPPNGYTIVYAPINRIILHIQ